MVDFDGTKLGGIGRPGGGVRIAAAVFATLSSSGGEAV